MDRLSITKTDEGIHIEGFPDAVRLVELNDPKARRISDLMLHQHDLEFADGCLEAINATPPDSLLVREALWRSAIIHFAKCFGGSAARFQLDRKKIYKNEPPDIR